MTNLKIQHDHQMVMTLSPSPVFRNTFRVKLNRKPYFSERFGHGIVAPSFSFNAQYKVVVHFYTLSLKTLNLKFIRRNH